MNEQENYNTFISWALITFNLLLCDFSIRLLLILNSGCLQFQLDRTLIWNAEENFSQESFKRQVAHGIPSKEAANFTLGSQPWLSKLKTNWRLHFISISYILKEHLVFSLLLSSIKSVWICALPKSRDLSWSWCNSSAVTQHLCIWAGYKELEDVNGNSFLKKENSGR